MVDTFKPMFSLLGNRKYVQITTFWRCLQEYFDSKGGVDFTELEFRKKVFSQVDFYVEEGRQPSIQHPNAVFRVTNANGNFVISVKENGTIINERIPYDEDALVEKGVVDVNDKSIVINDVNTESLINIIVAANKRLLLTLLDNTGYVSWSVAKWKIKWHALEEAVEAGGVLKVQVRHVLGMTYARSSILVNETEYGTIEYARKKEEEL